MSEDKSRGWLSRPGMVEWFKPSLLAQAAIRAAISPVFGTFADARAAQAGADGYSAEELRNVAARHVLAREDVAGSDGAVWIDYLADTGDGFDSVYAMASLVAAPNLSVGRVGGDVTYTLPAARLFVLGGDQVYPYPSREEYDARFVFPYKMAFSDPSPARLTFVIPGNHDWYDGLNSFDFLFCQARYGVAGGSRIANLSFPQHRSYFAIRLPDNWWIWGADIQFSPYLDAGQSRYFQAVAEAMRARRPEEPEHKIILCIAQPGWQYEGEEARAAISNITAIAELADQGGAKICTMISGDSHHYCRYYSKDSGIHLITAGGGGAFLHPTHQLRDDIDFPILGEPHSFTLNCRPTAKGDPAGSAPTPFPTKAQSFWLNWLNLFFPWWNYRFATLLGTLYWLMTWMFAQTAVPRKDCFLNLDGGSSLVKERRPLVEQVLDIAQESCRLQGDTLGARVQDFIGMAISAAINNFLLGIFIIALFMCCIAYADARRLWVKVLLGGAHWLAHIVAMVLLYIVVSYYGTMLGGWLVRLAEPYIGAISALLQTATYMGLMIFGGGSVAGFVWGGYLFLCCALGRRHWNDAFSSLRIADYKNFLRMKIEGEVLTIYPVGLKRPPKSLMWQRESSRPNARLVPRFGMKPELIDGPIVIDARKVRMRKERPMSLAGDLT